MLMIDTTEVYKGGKFPNDDEIKAMNAPGPNAAGVLLVLRTALKQFESRIATLEPTARVPNPRKQPETSIFMAKKPDPVTKQIEPSKAMHDRTKPDLSIESGASGDRARGVPAISTPRVKRPLGTSYKPPRTPAPASASASCSLGTPSHSKPPLYFSFQVAPRPNPRPAATGVTFYTPITYSNPEASDPRPYAMTNNNSRYSKTSQSDTHT